MTLQWVLISFSILSLFLSYQTQELTRIQHSQIQQYQLFQSENLAYSAMVQIGQNPEILKTASYEFDPQHLENFINDDNLKKGILIPSEYGTVKIYPGVKQTLIVTSMDTPIKLSSIKQVLLYPAYTP